MDTRMDGQTDGWIYSWMNEIYKWYECWVVQYAGCLPGVYLNGCVNIFFFLRFGVSFLTVSPLYSYSTTTRARPQQQYLINAAVVRVQKNCTPFGIFCYYFLYIFVGLSLFLSENFVWFLFHLSHSYLQTILIQSQLLF